MLAVGGCVFGDCEFETSTAQTTGGLFLADGRTVGDTLTLAFVDADTPRLVVDVSDDVLEARTASSDDILEVVYDAESTIFSSDAVVQPLSTTTVGDTVYVYISGSLDPTVFACSPGESVLEVAVRALSVPSGVVAVRVARLEARDLLPEAASRLHSAEADRLARAPISI